MANVLKVAAIQLCCGPDIDENFVKLSGLIRRAAEEGAELISTPENSCAVFSNRMQRIEHAQFEEASEIVPALKALAKELGVTLHIGSITSIKVEEARIANRTFVFSPKGEELARYDKIHLCEVLPGDGNHYREEENVVGGNRAVLVDIGMAKLGLSICYDLRFPHLYRYLAQKGADILMTPAAWFRGTGYAWDVLNRARAIENGCYVIGAAQSGTHPGGRQSNGQSMIVNPRGDILEMLDHDSEGFLVQDIDLDMVKEARRLVPSLNLDKEFT